MANIALLDGYLKKLGYNVLVLDRINYAGLTKQGLKNGHWRQLTLAEIKKLKTK